MNHVDLKEAITKGETSLGIEFGSTRIKAVLIDRRLRLSHREAMSGRIA